MNKKLLALAIGAAVAMPVVAEAAGPTLYGKINVTLDSVETDTGVPATSTDVWSLNSNASRLGVKGDAETGVTGLTGLYYAEYEIDADDGATPFKQRNIYAGLKGAFGTLKLGKMDTPLKEAQGKVDQFNDLAADIKNVMPGETRADNMIQYSSPKLADMFTVNLAVMPAENTNVDGEAGNEDGIADSISASVVLESGAFYAALAMDQSMTSASAVDTFTSGRADITRLVGAYKTDAFEVGAIFQTAEEVGTGAASEDEAMFLSGAFVSGDWKFKAQYGVGEGDVNDREKTMMAVGADYKLGKSTTVFGYYSTVETDNAAPPDTEITTLALGLEQKF
ncbi:MAG: porin [Pseudomonadota bacterium]